MAKSRATNVSTSYQNFRIIVSRNKSSDKGEIILDVEKWHGCLSDLETTLTLSNSRSYCSKIIMSAVSQM